MANEAELLITVMYSPAARQVCEWSLVLAQGSTVRQAVAASGLLHAFPDLALDTVKTGIWGRKVGLDHVLRAQDRVEIYRPLTVDPKVARRQRFVKQGARSAGLFEKKRPGAKAGY